MKYISLVLIAFILVLFSNQVQAQEVAVIANKSVPLSSIDAGKLISIYSLNMLEWSGGNAIKISCIKSGSDDVRGKFFGFLKTTEPEMKKVWLKKKLGEGTETPHLENDEDGILNWVKNTPGSIGFVSASKVTGDVKVLVKIK